jgi:hypothetical protein
MKKRTLLYFAFYALAIPMMTGFYIYVFDRVMPLWKYLIIVPLALIMIPLIIMLSKMTVDLIDTP